MELRGSYTYCSKFTITKEEIEFIVDIVAKSIREFIANEVDLFK